MSDPRQTHGEFPLLLTALSQFEKDPWNELTCLMTAGRNPLRRFCTMALLVLGSALLPSILLAQVPKLADIPNSLPAQLHQKLTQTRESLVAQRGELVKRAGDHNSKCNAVPRDTPEWKGCSEEQTELEAGKQRYIDAVNRFNDELARAISAQESMPQNNGDCQAAKRQADLDRTAIQRQLATNEMNQAERAEWEKLNGEAQKQAVLASVSFVVGAYAEDVEPVRDSVSKLDAQVAFLAKKAAKSRKFSTRMKYAAQFDAAAGELAPKIGTLLAKEIAEKASDAEEVWYLAHNTMQHEFRVAAKRNQDIRDALKDPEFKEAFSGDDLDTPGLDALSILAEKALEETGNFAFKLTKYEHYTGPAVNAAVFVRDAWYSARLSYESTERVKQQNDVAGDFARAAAVLQLQYKRSIDAVHACLAP